MAIMIQIKDCRHDIRGSLWRRWDLHFHTPSSYDRLAEISNQDIISSLIDNDIEVVAITDHHVIDVQRIKELQKIGRDKITVLPGIELRDTHGAKPIHYICIFPENCDIERIWAELEIKLELTAHDIKEKGGHECVYVDIKSGAKLAQSLGVKNWGR